jgi:hypothetical protein
MLGSVRTHNPNRRQQSAQSAVCCRRFEVQGSGAALAEDVGEEGELDEDADGDPGPCRQRRRRDEPLDQTGDDEQQGAPEDEGDGPPALFRERVGAPAVTGGEHGPADAQPRSGGDGDGGQLEQPVRRDETEELPDLAGVGEHAAGHAEVGAVDGEQRRARQGRERAAGEGEHRHLDVVDRDVGGELLGRRLRVVVLEFSRHVGRPLLGREGSVASRLGAGNPHAEHDGGHEEARRRGPDGPPALPHRRRERDPEERHERRPRPRSAPVDHGVGIGDDPVEPRQQTGIVVGGAGMSEVARHLLVALDQLLDLARGHRLRTPPGRRGERLEAEPGLAVPVDEPIDVEHAAS